MEDSKNIIKKLNVVDLFSGGGGMSLGFMEAGFNVVASFDNWDVAIKHCKLNFEHPAIKCDLSDVDGAVKAIRLYSPDVLIGGPPCQDFSSAGKRDESGGRADLTIAFAEIVKILSPTYFVMENVDRALKSNAFEMAKNIFSSAGYGLTIKILDASLCGVPQIRKRLFVIGIKNEDDNILYPFLMKNISERPLSVREYFGNKIDIDYYYRHPRSYKRRGIFSVDEPSPTIRGVNRPVPDGYLGHEGDPVKISKSLRPLSSRERAMIQTFPENYILDGTKSEIEQVIGNAVPVKLGKFVAESIKSFIINSSSPENIKFCLFEEKGDYNNIPIIQKAPIDTNIASAIKAKKERGRHNKK